VSDEQFTQIMRWFEKLSASVAQLQSEMTEVRAEVHATRELMSQLQDDDRVQRSAIAEIARRIEALEGASG
jgi:cell division protein FtsB